MNSFVYIAFFCFIACAAEACGEESVLEYPIGDSPVRFALEVNDEAKATLDLTNQGRSGVKLRASIWRLEDGKKLFYDFPLDCSLQMRDRKGKIVEPKPLFFWGWFAPSLMQSRTDPDKNLRALDLGPGETRAFDFECRKILEWLCRRESLNPKDLEYRIRVGIRVERADGEEAKFSLSSTWKDIPVAKP